MLLNSIYLKYTNISKLPDFDLVQLLHSTSAFVDMIFYYMKKIFSILYH